MVTQMIKVKISHACQSWGQCVFDAPEVFSLSDGERKEWEYTVDSEVKNKIKLAATHCPNRAISYKEIK
jgi:ferredoxin